VNTIDAGLWAPVVHGRTRRVDIWWRALPAGITQDGPEARVILAAVGGGRFPDSGEDAAAPRFVLARLGSGTLIGAACQFRQISTRMHADGNRALYGFVGWFSPSPRVAVPPLAQVESQWAYWAAAEYDRWMWPVWDETTGRVRRVDQTTPEPPRWQQAGVAAYDGPEIGPEQFSVYNTPGLDYVRVYSSAVRDRIWQGVAVYGREAAVVTGWASPAEAVKAGVTHACVEGLPAAYERIDPVPAQDRQKAASTPATPGRAYGEGTKPYPGGNQYQGSRPTAAGPSASDSYSRSVPGEQPQSGQWYRAGPARQPDQQGALGDERADPGDRPGFIGRLLGGADQRRQPPDEDPGVRRPPEPPEGRTWHFNFARRAFRVKEGHYTYQAVLGAPYIDCWEEHDKVVFRFRPTDAGWSLETPTRSHGAGSAGSPVQPRPGQAPPAAAGHGPPASPPVRPPQLPEDLGTSFNAMFDDWGGDPPPAKGDGRDG
jgi:hypothetical protein